MAWVSSLEAEKRKRARTRVTAMADAIEKELRATGSTELHVRADAVSDRTEWRRAAVIAAHRIGYPGATLDRGGLLSLFVGKPSSPLEDRLAADVVAAWITHGRDPRHVRSRRSRR
ncbi:MAG TPA: hypothetical protein VE990_15115 [Acidimicrobiales bacterium]|nr:hypothetical protein [Acidimicrobiales bacterium]